MQPARSGDQGGQVRRSATPGSRSLVHAADQWMPYPHLPIAWPSRRRGLRCRRRRLPLGSQALQEARPVSPEPVAGGVAPASSFPCPEPRRGPLLPQRRPSPPRSPGTRSAAGPIRRVADPPRIASSSSATSAISGLPAGSSGESLGLPGGLEGLSAFRGRGEPDPAPREPRRLARPVLRAGAGRRLRRRLARPDARGRANPGDSRPHRRGAGRVEGALESRAFLHAFTALPGPPARALEAAARLHERDQARRDQPQAPGCLSIARGSPGRRGGPVHLRPHPRRPRRSRGTARAWSCSADGIGDRASCGWMRPPPS